MDPWIRGTDGHLIFVFICGSHKSSIQLRRQTPFKTPAIHVCLQVLAGMSRAACPVKDNLPKFNPPNLYWVLIRQSLGPPKFRSIRYICTCVGKTLAK